jgi:uncharacterized membrane protein YGL010W
MGMRRVADWLNEYGDSHRHPTNKRLHWICVPVIVWCALGFLFYIPVPRGVALPFESWASIGVLALLVYYAFLSLPLALGALPVFALMLWSIAAVSHASPVPLWALCGALFVAAWIGQFIGHAIECKRPSFFKDLQFLLIGPLWLLADLFRRLGYDAAAPNRST